MKKVQLLIILLPFSMLTNAQKYTAQYCTGKGYRGYVFDASYSVDYKIERQRSRIDLTFNDVEEAEKLLKRNLGVVTVGLLERYSRRIVTQLDGYYRQYFGYTNWNGDTVIWINLFCNENRKEQAAHSEISTMDGGSCYWRIEVNITTQRLSNLGINGLG